MHLHISDQQRDMLGSVHTPAQTEFTDIEAGRGVLYPAAVTANPFPDPFMAVTAKVLNNEMSLRLTSEGVQLHGGFGFTDEYPVSRFYHAARCGITSETLRDLISKRLVNNLDAAQRILSPNTY